ncbi:MAG TPA: Pr6Pr family membrane protein, partial [Solirubrobacteraceae bacterium]|nr:Pr6Pr family membrane protein [Solirubrobacteraceae bacterium]
FPICWLAFTLIRGALAHWYPYPFIDVTHLGYFKAAVDCVWVALLLLGLSAGAKLLDGWLARRGTGSEAA